MNTTLQLLLDDELVVRGCVMTDNDDPLLLVQTFLSQTVKHSLTTEQSAQSYYTTGTDHSQG